MRGIIGGLAAAILGSTAAAQEGAGPVFVLERAPVVDMLHAPKDAGLVRAINLIPARLSELRGEVPGWDGPGDAVIELLSMALSRPFRLAVLSNPGHAVGGAFGYGLVVSVQVGNQAAADRLHTSFGAMVDFSAPRFPKQASARFPGMVEIQLPVAAMTYGPRADGDVWRYELLIGSVDDPAAGFDALPAPLPGMTPIVRAAGDLRNLNPLVGVARVFLGQQDPQAFAEMIAHLERAGIVGEGAVGFSAQHGSRGDAGFGRMVIHRARPFASAWGLAPGVIGPNDLLAVPSDSVYAGVSRFTTEPLVRAIREAGDGDPDLASMMREFRERTGIDVLGRVLPAFGGSVVYYMSESTGGGGLFSSVLLLGIADRAEVVDASARARAAILRWMDEETDLRGRVTFREWSSGGVELVSLRFPGLPVPFEPTYAIVGDWLIASATPQAALAGALQALGRGDGGLTANPRFLQGMGDAMDRPIHSVVFADTPMLLRDGYAPLSLIGSAVGNAVRSAADADRDPGMVVPTYRELAHNARGLVQIGYWVGDDYVTDVVADRSFLVNTAGVTGVVQRYVPFVAGFVGAGVMNATRARGRGWGAIDLDGLVEPAMGEDRDGAPGAAALREVFARLGATPAPASPERMAILAVGAMLEAEAQGR